MVAGRFNARIGRTHIGSRRVATLEKFGMQVIVLLGLAPVAILPIGGWQFLPPSRPARQGLDSTSRTIAVIFLVGLIVGCTRYGANPVGGPFVQTQIRHGCDNARDTCCQQLATSTGNIRASASGALVDDTPIVFPATRFGSVR